MNTIQDGLPREQQRCREVLVELRMAGPDAKVGADAVEEALRRADRAAASHDVPAMLRAYHELLGIR